MCIYLCIYIALHTHTHSHTHTHTHTHTHSIIQIRKKTEELVSVYIRKKKTGRARKCVCQGPQGGSRGRTFLQVTLFPRNFFRKQKTMPTPHRETPRNRRAKKKADKIQRSVAGRKKKWETRRTKRKKTSDAYQEGETGGRVGKKRKTSDEEKKNPATRNKRAKRADAWEKETRATRK